MIGSFVRHTRPALPRDDSHNVSVAQGGVEAGESLLAAAKRELTEETGPNMDVWPAGRVPAGHYAYSFPKSYKKTPHAGANVRQIIISRESRGSISDFLSSIRSTFCR